MLEGFVPILILLVLAITLVSVIIIASFFISPKKPSAAKSAPYEGGVPQMQATPRRFPIKFLEVAMLFLIFDIETVAFFPWAVLLNQLKLFGLIEMGLFLLVLGIGYLYLWRKGAFNWEKEF